MKRPARNEAGPHRPAPPCPPIDPALVYPWARLSDWGFAARSIAALRDAGLVTLRFGKRKFFRGSALIAVLENGNAATLDGGNAGRGTPMSIATKRKSGHDRILPIDSIEPSPENEKLYRPVDPKDPDIIGLADSIREHGIKESLVVTLDRFIVSGHRRYVAARLAGLTEVPCRVERVRRLNGCGQVTDEFLRLLAEYNRQRVKSFDEQLREAIVSVNPTAAYRSLIDHREQKSADALEGADVLYVPDGKERARISEAKQPFLEAVKAVLSERPTIGPCRSARSITPY